MQIEQQRKKPDSLYHSAKKYGLPDTAMCVLYLVTDGSGDMTQQDLCRQSCYAKQRINTAVNSLPKSGFFGLSLFYPGVTGRLMAYLREETGKL